MSNDPYIESPQDAPPLRRITVDISVGHGTLDGWTGTQSTDGRLKEAMYNRTKLRPAIEAEFKGNSQFGIRWWDAIDHPEWRQHNKSANYLLLDRLEAMYASDTPAIEIAVALHCNASVNKEYGGFMSIYRQDIRGDSEEARNSRCMHSELLSGLLCDELDDALPMKNRGPKPDRGPWVDTDLAFTRWAKRRKAVGVLLELGFMTHDKDVRVLELSDTPKKVATSLLYALESFISLRSQYNAK